MASISLNTREAMLRLGGRGPVIPNLGDELVPVISFGSVSDLVPTPSAARALAARVLSPGPGDHATWEVKFGSDAVVEQLWVVGTGPAASAFSIQLAASDLGGIDVGVMQLGGPNVRTTLHADTPAATITAEAELPNELRITGLEWAFQRGQRLRVQYQEPGDEAGFGCTFREYQTVPGPE